MFIKDLLISSASPLGRIGAREFWKRQAWLALLAALGLAVSFTCAISIFGRSGDCLWTALCVAPLLLAHGNPLFVLVWGIVGNTAPELGGGGLAPEYSLAILLLVLLYLPALLLCVFSCWCSLALLLRRLRDTALRLWGLPFCTPLLWVWLLAPADIESDAAGAFLAFISILVTLATLLCFLVLTNLPSRKQD